MINQVKDQFSVLEKKFSDFDKNTLNESQTRLSFIDKFWNVLGWDVGDPRQVLVETVDKRSKRPDYRFINNNKTLFFVEAKKPVLRRAL